MKNYYMNSNTKSNISAARRKRVIQLRMRLATLAVCLIALFILAFISDGTVSDAENNRKKVKLFTSIEVSYGDTLYDIASQYVDENYKNTTEYINEVVKINSLDNSDKIVAGQYIIVPYYAYIEE